MENKDIDKWRYDVNSRLEELTVMNAKQSSELAHIKDSTTEIKNLVREQNGRVRRLEQSNSAIKAIGSIITVVFSTIIAWLFKVD